MEKNTSEESMLAGAAGLIKESPTAPAVAANPAITAPVVAPVANTAPATQVTQTAPAPPVVNAPLIIKTPLGDQIYGGIPTADVKLSNFADVQAFAKDFAGIELKEVQDFVPLLTNFKQSKEQAASAAALQKQVENFTSTIENLPQEVSLILNTAVSGGDHMAVINNMQKKAALAYDKSFESQDLVKLTNHYTDKQFTQETFDTLDPTSKDVLTTSIKARFEADKDAVLNFEKNTKKATEDRQTKYVASVDASISAWTAENPNVDKAAVAEVKKTMLYGLSDELFTKDKNYTPDAAKKIAMMKYGEQIVTAQKQTIGEIVAKMQNAGASKAIENIILKSDKPPLANSTNQNNNVIATEVEKATSWLKPKR